MARRRKTIRTIPQAAHADARAGAAGRGRATSRKSPAATVSKTRCARRNAACMCPDQPCVARLPGRASTSPASSRRSPRRISAAPTTSSPTPTCCRDLRPRVPAGEPVRRRVHRRRHAGAGGDRPPGALRRRHGDQRRLGQRSLHRAHRLQGRHRGVRPGRHGVRRRHGQGRLRSHGLRGVPPARRRAASTAFPTSGCRTT